MYANTFLLVFLFSWQQRANNRIGQKPAAKIRPDDRHPQLSLRTGICSIRWSTRAPGEATTTTAATRYTNQERGEQRAAATFFPPLFCPRCPHFGRAEKARTAGRVDESTRARITTRVGPHPENDFSLLPTTSPPSRLDFLFYFLSFGFFKGTSPSPAAREGDGNF